MKTLLICSFFCCFGSTIFGQVDFSEENRISHALLKKMDAKVVAGDYEEITSILIARNGKLIYENYYNGADISSKHNTRSATKTLATLLTGIAIDRGFIASEQDKILPYLSHKLPLENKDARKNNITIEDLLTMSSILECNDNDEFSRGNENRMYIVEDWSKFYLDLPIRAYPYSPKPKDSPYGRAMSYCSAGSAIVAEIVQSAVKMPADKFAKEQLLDPLGIEDFTLHYSPLGTLNTAGGSEYRSRDFLKIVQLCANKGKWNGHQLISQEWIEKATTPKANAWEGMDYGYLFWLKSFGEGKPVKSFAMAGNGGNKLVVFPALDITVVLTSTNYNNRKAHGYTDEILDKFIVPALIEE